MEHIVRGNFIAEYQESAQREREIIEQDEPLVIDAQAGEGLKLCPDAPIISVPFGKDLKKSNTTLKRKSVKKISRSC